MRFTTVRLVMIGLVLATALCDLITFLVSSDFWGFEINPVWVLTRSVAVIVVLKVCVIAGFCFFLWKGVRVDWMNYLLVIMAVYAILFQAYGTYSNLHVVYTNPSSSTALSESVAVRTYATLVFFFEVVPLLLATLAFKIHKWCHYDDE